MSVFFPGVENIYKYNFIISSNYFFKTSNLFSTYAIDLSFDGIKEQIIFVECLDYPTTIFLLKVNHKEALENRPKYV